MAITYTWSISNMEHEISDGAVITAHWYCLGTDAAGISARSYGSTSYTPDPSAAGFIPYADLTEEIVLGWLHGSVDKDATEASIAAKIDAIANPTTAAGMPWVSEEAA